MKDSHDVWMWPLSVNKPVEMFLFCSLRSPARAALLSTLKLVCCDWRCCWENCPTWFIYVSTDLVRDSSVCGPLLRQSPIVNAGLLLVFKWGKLHVSLLVLFFALPFKVVTKQVKWNNKKLQFAFKSGIQYGHPGNNMIMDVFSCSFRTSWGSWRKRRRLDTFSFT